MYWGVTLLIAMLRLPRQTERESTNSNVARCLQLMIDFQIFEYVAEDLEVARPIRFGAIDGKYDLLEIAFKLPF
jgi:hypothetical protein